MGVPNGNSDQDACRQEQTEFILAPCSFASDLFKLANKWDDAYDALTAEECWHHQSADTDKHQAHHQAHDEVQYGPFTTLCTKP